MTPEGEIFGKVNQLGAVARLRFPGPLAHFVEIVQLIQAIEHGRVLCALDSLQAGIVGAPFHVAGRELSRQHPLKKRNVFLHQLLLQILRPRRDDDATPARRRRRDCRNEIRERLARACARFHNQVTLLLERAQHCLCHLNLARTIFVFRMSASD